MKIIRTQGFTKQFDNIKDSLLKTIIADRVRRLKDNDFGDTRSLGDGIFELRIHYGSGYRIYYTMRGNDIVILLWSGSKSDQKRDIEKAKIIAKEERQ